MTRLHHARGLAEKQSVPSANHDLPEAVCFIYIPAIQLAYFTHLISSTACSQSACIACCSDLQCEGHREARENAQWKEAVLKGTTDVQKRAKAKRASAILPGTFREPGFLFMNQTITIWDREQFMANKKWREDAIRRADKRKARNMNHSSKPIRNNVNRFRLVMEDLYRNSLKQNTVNMAVEEAKSAIETIGKRESRERTSTSTTEQGPEETDSGKRTSPGCKLS